MPQITFLRHHYMYMRNRNAMNLLIVPTDPQEMVTCIDSVKRKHSSGHENITSTSLRDIKYNDISFPLAIFINKSFFNWTRTRVIKTV